MIKIITEFYPPDYHALADVMTEQFAKNPELASKLPAGASPQMLKMALGSLPNEQISSILISALEAQGDKACRALEQSLRQAGMDIEVLQVDASAEDGLTFVFLGNVRSWDPFLSQMLPRLVDLTDLPARMGEDYFVGATANDYAKKLLSLPMYEQTTKFFSCCTAAKDRFLAQAEQMLTQKSLPIQIKNMRFFVKR